MMTTKTIFALRKEGRLDEAYAGAVELYNAQPNDEWTIKAYAWVLIAMIWVHIKAHTNEKTQPLMAALNALPGKAFDTVLNEKVAAVKKVCSPAGDMLAQARAASKAGDSATAIKLYVQLLKAEPASRDVCIGYGWELQKALKQEAAAESPDIERCMRIIQIYLGLGHHETPGLLHSLLISATTKLHKELGARYTGILRQLGESFRPEDLQPYRTDDGKEFDSLVENVIKALAHSVNEDNPDSRWACALVEKYATRFPNNEWVPYYLGKLLIAVGRKADARKHVLPVLRVKAREFWAWDVLADTCDSSETHLRVAALCRAVLCGAKPAFLVNVHARLGFALHDAGEDNAARHEIEQAISIRSKNKWKITPALQQVIREAWFIGAKPTGDNRTVYEKHAPAAEELLTDDMPWVAGVVNHVNTDKGILKISINARSFGLVNVAWMPDACALAEGDYVDIRCHENPMGDIPLQILRVRPNPTASLPHVHEGSGHVMIRPDANGRFGFVENAYVSGRLLAEYGIQNGDVIKGMAVEEWSEEKGMNQFALVRVIEINGHSGVSRLRTA